MFKVAKRRNVNQLLHHSFRYVEAYLATDIAAELGLKRHDLISLALLLGSDYTAGIKGVGIVNAMEILQAFPSTSEDAGIRDDALLRGLRDFKAWHSAYNPITEALSEVDRKKRKKKGKRLQKEASTSSPDNSGEVDLGDGEFSSDSNEDLLAAEVARSSDSVRTKFEHKHRNARYFAYLFCCIRV